MKTFLPIGLVVLPVACPAPAQGPLAPPGGPPQAQGKSLQEIYDKACEVGTASDQLLSTVGETSEQVGVLDLIGSLYIEYGAIDPPWHKEISHLPVLNGLSLAYHSGFPGPGISYTDNGGQRFSLFNNADSLYAEVVDSDGHGTRTSLAFTDEGRAAIATTSNDERALLYSLRSGPNTWTTEVVDPVGGIIKRAGLYPSLAMTPGGVPSISSIQQDGTTWKLRFSVQLGATWGNSTLVTETLTFPARLRETSLAYSPAGNAAVAFIQVGGAAEGVRFVAFDGASWIPSTVEAGADFCGVALAIGPSGQPCVSYANTTTDEVRYAEFDGSTWQLSTVDTRPVGVGEATSLAFTPGGNPAIAYADDDGTLFYTPSLSGAWNPAPVTAPNVVSGNGYVSLAFTPSGLPGIAYAEDVPGGFRRLSYVLKGPSINP